MLGAYFREQRGQVSYRDYLARLKERIRTIEQLAPDQPLALRDPALRVVFEEQYRLPAGDDPRLLFHIAGQMNEAEIVPQARLAVFSGLSDAEDPLRPPFSNALADLFRKSLVEELEAKRTRLHPLVWEFSRSLLPESEAAALRAECARRVRHKFHDIVSVEAEAVARENDFGPVCRDIELAGNWARPGPERDMLQTLARLLNRELHNLREGRSFVQQLACRAARMGIKDIRDRLTEKASRQGTPFLRPVSVEPVEDPALIRTLKEHSDWVKAVALSQDSQTAVSGSEDSTLIVWDVRTGQEQLRLALAAAVGCVALARSCIAVGLRSGEVEFFDLLNVKGLRPAF